MASNRPTSYTDKIADETATLTEKVSEGTSQLKAKASEYGRAAADRIDEGIRSAASGMESAAASLHQTADNLPGVDTARRMAHSTADKLSASADYIREHDVDTMVTGVRAVVRKNPGESLIIAGIIGFLIGRAFTRNNAD